MAIENTNGKSINDSIQTNSKSTSFNKNQNDNLANEAQILPGAFNFFLKKMTFYSDNGSEIISAT